MNCWGLPVLQYLSEYHKEEEAHLFSRAPYGRSRRNWWKLMMTPPDLSRWQLMNQFCTCQEGSCSMAPSSCLRGIWLKHSCSRTALRLKMGKACSYNWSAARKRNCLFHLIQEQGREKAEAAKACLITHEEAAALCRAHSRRTALLDGCGLCQWTGLCLGTSNDSIWNKK